jgi:hypothetical protein
METRTMSWSKIYSTEAKNLQTLVMVSTGKLATTNADYGRPSEG